MDSNNPLEKDRVDWTPTLYKKIFFWSLTIVVVVCGLFLFAGYVEIKMQEKELLLERENYKKLVIDFQAQEADFEKRSKEDTYGGKTPEETLDLLIDSLLKKDLELSVKYFSINTQEKAKVNFEKELKNNGNYTDSINYYKEVKNKGKKTCSSNESCGFDYEYITESDEYVYFDKDNPNVLVPKGSTQSKYIQTIKNTYTSVWKVVEY